MATKTQYTTLFTPGTKKISVCARRVGSRDRMTVIATCTDETNADRIVDGLNLLQGEATKLSIPAEKHLDEVRACFEAERALTRSLQIKINELERNLTAAKNAKYAAEQERDRLRSERNAMMAASEKA